MDDLCFRVYIQAMHERPDQPICTYKGHSFLKFNLHRGDALPSTEPIPIFRACSCPSALDMKTHKSKRIHDAIAPAHRAVLSTVTTAAWYWHNILKGVPGVVSAAKLLG